MALNLVIHDVETVKSDLISRVQTDLGRTLYQGDPTRIVLQAIAYPLSVALTAANHAANQSFAKHADYESLVELAAQVGITPYPAEAAQTTLRFSLGAARESVTLIPIGTRATVSGSGINFATNVAAEIPIGDTYVDVIASADVLGISANGYAAGEINTLVDSISFVASVANIDASSDGSEAESSISLLARIIEAPAAFSTAGSEDAYKAMTQNARADIDDVSVHSPEPREMNVYFTLTGGAIPAAETIAEVLAYLSDDYRRPMSDLLTVAAPAATNYAISFAYYISRDDSAIAASIQDAVTAAVAEYVAWQRAKIGRDINPSKLVQLVMAAGARRVVVTTPVYATVDYAHLAVLSGTATITYGGFEDE